MRMADPVPRQRKPWDYRGWHFNYYAVPGNPRQYGPSGACSATGDKRSSDVAARHPSSLAPSSQAGCAMASSTLCAPSLAP